jgi:hypothetical protein
MILPLADLISSGGLLVAWTLATIILCLLGWLAFTLRQRQFRNDPDSHSSLTPGDRWDTLQQE